MWFPTTTREWLGLMWRMFWASSIVVTLASTGCARKVYSASKLVILQPSQAVESLDSGAGKSNITLAAHYWDAVGASIRMSDDIEPALEAQRASAEHLVVDTNNPLGLDADKEDAYYNDYEGAIHVIGLSNTYLFTAQSILAHEIGHAMGLNHVGAAEAIMSPSAWTLEAITDADATEFFRATGSR